MKRTHVVVGLLLAGMSMMMMAGCGSKVTKDNFDSIKDGMAMDEVVKILGEGTKQAGGSLSIGGVDLSGDIYVWEDGGKKITVSFKDGKVVGKAQTGL